MIHSGYRARFDVVDGGSGGLPNVFMAVEHPASPPTEQASADLANCRIEARATATTAQRVGLGLLQYGGLIPALFGALPAEAMAKEAGTAFRRCMEPKGYLVDGSWKWYRAGGFTDAEFKRDHEACDRDARQAIGGVKPFVGYEACMASLGYRQLTETQARSEGLIP